MTGSADIKAKVTYSAVDEVTKTTDKIGRRFQRMTAKMSRAMRKVDRINRKVRRGFSRLLKYSATAATGAFVGLFHAVNNTARSIDQLVKRAATMKFPIEKFQEWGYVATQSGISMETYQTSVQKFTRIIGETKANRGMLFTHLKHSDRRLLRTIKRTKDTAAAFEIMIKAIRKVEDPTKKAALAAAVFGRSGVDWVNVIDLGDDRLAELRKEMRENGVVTAEQAHVAEKYADAADRLMRSLTHLKVNALLPLMPVLVEAFDRLRKWAIANQKIVGGKVRKWLRYIVDNFDLIVKRLKQIGKGIVIFYSLSLFIRSATLAMTFFNLASQINWAPISALGSYLAGPFVVKAGASALAVGTITTALGVLTAAVASWAIGTLIHSKLVEPLMQALDITKKLREEHEQTMKSDLSKRNSAVLRKDIERAKRLQEIESKHEGGAAEKIVTFLGGASPKLLRDFSNLKKLQRDRELDKLRKARTVALDREIATEDARSTYIHDPSVPSPERTEAVYREKVEVVIKDDTGKAVMNERTGSRRKSRVRLVHTGGMVR